MEEAIRHSLLAGDQSEAARMIGETAESMFQSGYLATLREWLARLPEDLIRSDGHLSAAMCLILFFSGRQESLESYLASAEAAYRRDNDQRGIGKVYTMRSQLLVAKNEGGSPAIAEEVLRLSSKALEHLGKNDNLYAGFSLIIKGNARSWMGDSEGAVRCIEEALQLGESTDQPAVAIAALSDLVNTLEPYPGRGQGPGAQSGLETQAKKSDTFPHKTSFRFLNARQIS